MKLKTRIIALLLVLVAGPIASGAAVAQTTPSDEETTTVDIQVYSGAFNVTVGAVNFGAVQPGGISTGDLTISVEDQRAGGGAWSVQGKIDPFVGQETGHQFTASLLWKPTISPTGMAALDNAPTGEKQIKPSAEPLLVGNGTQRGTVTAGGPASVTVPLTPTGGGTFTPDTFSALITVTLYGEDPT